MHSCAEHLGVGEISDDGASRARGLDGRPDRVPFCAEGTGQKSCADLGHDSRDDDLRAVGCPDGVAKFRIVPGVDFSVASDYGCVRVEIANLLGDQAVGSCLGISFVRLSCVWRWKRTKKKKKKKKRRTILGGRSHHDGQIGENRAESGIGQSIVSVDNGICLV